jgi:hypothetical protein
VEYTILQTGGDRDSVVDALTTLSSRSWSDHPGIEHAQGWTTIPMDQQAAARFAPLLADLMGRGVLVWTVDAERCVATLVRANGETVEATDRPDQVNELTRAFRESHLLVTDNGKDESQLVARVTDVRCPPEERHKAFAGLLGVPHVAPGGQPVRSGTAPAVTNASMHLGSEGFRRRQRLRSARSWLHLVSGFGLVAIIGLVIKGPWLGIPVALALILVLQAIRFWLGRSLRSESSV